MTTLNALNSKSLIPVIVTWDSIYEPESGLNTAVYTNKFPTSINLDATKCYGIAIESIDTYYSFPNITPSNNVFSYTANGTPKTLTLPIGSYDVSTINSTIQDFLVANGDTGKITISSIIPQLKSSITIAANYTVNFTVPNSINVILGFNARILNPGAAAATFISDNIVNINKVNSILVNCDLISDSYVNGVMSPVIYTFFPNVAPGYKIVKELNRLEFVKINRSQISSFNVWLTDQDGNYVNFRGETITIRFYIGELI